MIYKFCTQRYCQAVILVLDCVNLDLRINNKTQLAVSVGNRVLHVCLCVQIPVKRKDSSTTSSTTTVTTSTVTAVTASSGPQPNDRSNRSTQSLVKRSLSSMLRNGSEEDNSRCSKKDFKTAAEGSSRFTIYKVNKASRKKREKSSARKERKATKTLAIVLGEYAVTIRLISSRIVVIILLLCNISKRYQYESPGVGDAERYRGREKVKGT